MAHEWRIHCALGGQFGGGGVDVRFFLPEKCVLRLTEDMSEETKCAPVGKLTMATGPPQGGEK